MSIFRISEIVKNAIGKIGKELRIYVFGKEKGLCGMKRKMGGDRTNETRNGRRALRTGLGL